MLQEWHNVHGHHEFTMPEEVTIPKGFVDTSYRNDESPSWTLYDENKLASNPSDPDSAKKVTLYIHYGYFKENGHDEQLKTYHLEWSPNQIVPFYGYQVTETYLDTDNWQTVLDALKEGE
jgi:hypothetical protein